MNRLKQDFFIRDVLEVAPELLGARIVISTNGTQQNYTINELEAYKGEEDLACHASKGRTKRTEIMYQEGGHVYVYLIYGMYWMFNIVTGISNIPQAILIRGIKNCNGPGRVGKLLGINKSFYGENLCSSSRIWIEKPIIENDTVITTKPRIGIDYADKIWRNKQWRYIHS